MNKETICKNLSFYRWNSEKSTILNSTPEEYEIDDFFDEIRSDEPYKNDNCFVVNKSINGKQAKDFLCPCIVFFDIDFHFEKEEDKINEIKKFCVDTKSQSLQDFVNKLSNDKYIISAGLSRSGKGIRGFACVDTSLYTDSIMYDLDYSVELNKAIHKSNFNYVMNYLSENYGLDLESKYSSDLSPSKLSQITYRFKREGSFYNEDWEPMYNDCVIELKEYSNLEDREVFKCDFLDTLLSKNMDIFKQTFEHYDKFNSIFYVLRNQPDEIILWFYNMIDNFYSSDGGFRKQGHLDSPEAFMKHVKLNNGGEDLPLRSFLFKRGIIYDEVLEEESIIDFSEIKASVLPIISNEVYKKLPKILRDITQDYINQKRDFFLLSSLITTSIYFNNVSSVYFEGNEMYPNLYFFGIGNSSSGKSSIRKVKILTNKLERTQREEYRIKLNEWNNIGDKEKKDKKPPEIKYILGGDGGRASLIKYLLNNNEQVLFWDTEADSLSQNKKTDWGDITPLLRAGVMNEPIDKNRSGDDSIHIECPKISVNITGTPEQVNKVIGEDGIVNGTFARFLWYWWYSDKCEIEDPHKHTDNSMFIEYGDMLYNLWLKLKDKELNFDFTKEQKSIFFDRINIIFKSFIYSNPDITDVADSLLKKYFNFSKKITMILTMLRMLELDYMNIEVDEDYLFTKKPLDVLEIDSLITPTNDDLFISLEIIQVCLKHALCFLRSNNHEDNNKEPKQNWADDFYAMLPNKIKRVDAKKLGMDKFGKSDRTVRRALEGFREQKKLEWEDDSKEVYQKIK